MYSCLFKPLAYHFCIVTKIIIKANDPIGINWFQNRQLQWNFYTINIASIVELSVVSDLTCIPRFKLFFQEFLCRTVHSQVKRLKMICHVSWNINNDAIITFDNFLDSGRCLSLKYIEAF